MKGVTSEVIAEVRSKANIIDIISETVVLKRAGKDYRGLCPFHKEKTPSFHVNVEKGIYKCFGCGEGGDVFAFIQKAKGLDFIETVKELAHKFAVPLAETAYERNAYDRRTQFLMLYEQACEYYFRLLNHPQQGLLARRYLESRAVSPEIIKKFRLGYAPNVWDGLLGYLTESNKVAPATLEECGLVRQKNEGTGYFDLFRNRLMIPICDDQGRVIAFGGRTFGEDQIKYLNSPETQLYTKGQNLYALNLAKESIKSNDGVIVVEGYFDAITAHQCGFTNAVATLGTALTIQQAKTLVRYTESKRVFLAFDSDAAGLKAVDRGIETLNEIAQGVGIELKVISIPAGKDPDECLHADDGVAQFKTALTNAPLLLDHQINCALDKVNFATHTGKIDAAKQVTPVLAHINNAVARGEYIRQVALRIKIREEELLSDVNSYRRDHHLRGQPANDRPFSQRFNVNPPGAKLPMPDRRNAPINGTMEAERQLLALFLLSKEGYETAYGALADERFAKAAHETIKESIYGIGSSFNNMEDLRGKLMDRLAPDKEASTCLIEIILKAEEMLKQKTPIKLVIREGRCRLVKDRLGQLTENLRHEVASTKNEEELMNLQSKIRELTRLERIVLPNLNDISEVDELQRKIDEISSCLPKLETKV